MAPGPRTVAPMATDIDLDPRSLTDLAMAVETITTPLERLAALRSLKDALTELEHATVEEARTQRRTWNEIATALQISKQGAQQRHSRPRVRAPSDTSEPPKRPRRKEPTGWDVTTPRGRRILSVVKR